jgi:hypothetical protein
LEHTKELSAVQSAALLRSEEIVGAVSRPCLRPRTERDDLVQQGLPAVRVEGLSGTERALEALNREATIFQVNVAKTGAKDTAKGTKKAADATADATKTAAKDTAKGTEKAADATVKGTKKVAKGTEKAAQKTGEEVKKGVEAVVNH